MSTVTTAVTAASHAHAGSPVYTRSATTTSSAPAPNKRAIAFAPSISISSPASSRSSSASSLSLTVATVAPTTPTKSRLSRTGVSTRPFPSSSSSSLSLSSSSPSSSPPTPTTPSTPTRTTPTYARRRGRIHDMASDSYYSHMPTSPGAGPVDNPTKAPSYLQYLGSPSSPSALPSTGYALLEPLSPITPSRTLSQSGAYASSADADTDMDMDTDADRPRTPPTPTSPRLVRFDTACVLIPELAPVASSSSLSPLSPGGLMGVQVQVGRMELRMPWGRGRGKKEKEKEKERDKEKEEKFDILGEDGADAFLSREEREKEKGGVVIRVPIPLFRRRSSSATRAPYPSSPPQAFLSSASPPGPTSHIRRRAESTSPAVPHRELQSCLVHRQHGFAEASASMARAMAVVREEGDHEHEGKEAKEGGGGDAAAASSEKPEKPLTPVRRPSLPSRTTSASSIPPPFNAHVRSSSLTSAPSSSPSPHPNPNPVYTNPSPFLADGTTPNPAYIPSETVPLRACCAACAGAMERMDEALRRGEAWEERFTRGARRRRRAGSLQGTSGSGDFGGIGAGGFGGIAMGGETYLHGQMRGVRDMSAMPTPSTSTSPPAHMHAHGMPVVPKVFQGLKAALDADLDAAVRRASSVHTAATSSATPSPDGEVEVEEDTGLAARALRVDEVDGAKRASTGLSIAHGLHGLGIKGVGFPAGIAGSSGGGGQKVDVVALDSPSAESVSDAESYFSLPPQGEDQAVSTSTSGNMNTPPPPPATTKYLSVLDTPASLYRAGQRTASPIAEEHEHEHEHDYNFALKKERKDEDDMDLFPLPRRSPAGSARSSLRSASGSSSLNGSPRASTSSVNLNLDLDTDVDRPSNAPSNTIASGKPALHLNLSLSPGSFDRRGGRVRQRTPSPLGRHVEGRVGGAGVGGEDDDDVGILGASLSRRATPPPIAPAPVVAPTSRAVRALPALPQNASPSPNQSQPGSVKALPTPPLSPPHGRERAAEAEARDAELELQQALRAADSLPPVMASPSAAPQTPPVKRERSESRTRERSLSRGQQQQQQQERQQGRRKLSLTAPFIKAGGVLREAGADVLRGVSSMSGPGVV